MLRISFFVLWLALGVFLAIRTFLPTEPHKPPHKAITIKPANP